MDDCTPTDCWLLIGAITEAGPGSFAVRRTLQRLDRGELTVDQAVAALEAARGARGRGVAEIEG